MFCNCNSDCRYFTYILCVAHCSPPHHLARTVLATCRIFSVVWTSELEICYSLGLLPPLPPPHSISFSHLFLVWAQIFPFPSLFIFSPASFQCLCTFSLPSLLFCPLHLHSFHFKTYIGADTRLPIPCSTELAVWKEEAAVPSRGKTEFRVCLIFKYASEHGWSEEQKKSSGSECWKLIRT